MENSDNRMEVEAPTCLPEQAFQDVLGVLLRYSHLAKFDDAQFSPAGESGCSTQSDSAVKQLEAKASHLAHLATLFQRSLQSHVAQILRRRNLLLPINRLPPELLAIIFRFVQDSEEDDEEAIWAVMRLTQVCVSWDSIATSIPHLWTIIDTSFPLTLMESTISRSRDMPLRVNLHGVDGDHEREQVFELIRPHVARWKSLNITSRRFNELFRLRLGDAWMPCLESFVRQTSTSYSVYVTEIPAAILHRAPRLQTLEVDRFTFPLEAPSFSVLRTLEFTACDGSEDFSSTEWHSLLSAAPQLEYIHGSSVGGDLEWDPPAIPFHVELQNLKTLILENIPLSVAKVVLCSIFVPQGTYPLVEARYPRGFSNPSGFRGLFAESTPPNSLLDVVRSMTWMSIHCNQSDRTTTIQAEIEPRKPCWLSMSLNKHYVPNTVFETLVPSVGLPTLRSLSLSGKALFEGGVFVRSLPSFPNVTTLSFSCPGASQAEQNNIAFIFGALSSPTSGNGGGAVWPLPHLRTLGLKSPHALDLALPLVEARYGLGQSENTPQLLEVLKLVLLRPPDQSTSTTSFHELRRVVEGLGIALEVTASREHLGM
ncbi:hypothetical protein FRC03_009254 [Tulasnella sp. 419]|nr:hypothetical protein FRC03_009254 [Tulasnella sp. 419]